MSTKVIWVLVIFIVVSLGATTFIFFRDDGKKTFQANNCVFEIKTCADGTNVTRIGKECNFAACPNETPTEPKEEVSTESFSTSTAVATPSKEAPASSVQPSPQTPPKEDLPKEPTTESPSLFSSLVSSLQSAITQTGNAVQNAASSLGSSISNLGNNQNPPPSNTNTLDTEKYTVVNGNIVGNNNSIIYTIPQEILDTLGTTTEGWTNTPINVVPVGDVAPILNAIPIEGLPGKYYLSENSFGNIEQCEFSNKIYILDTATNEVTLMYEENHETLSRDDPRACNSEIILLATSEEELILKYHTLNTGTLCDSSWSEPDKTWYLDVTNLALGMRRYYIPDDLRINAETQEETCRQGLGQ